MVCHFPLATAWAARGYHLSCLHRPSTHMGRVLECDISRYGIRSKQPAKRDDGGEGYDGMSLNFPAYIAQSSTS